MMRSVLNVGVFVVFVGAVCAQVSSPAPAVVPTFDIRAATVVVRTTNPAHPSVNPTGQDKFSRVSLLNYPTTPDNHANHDFVCTGATSGANSDSAVIQAAIDYLNSSRGTPAGNRGGRLVLMEGTYNLSVPINIVNPQPTGQSSSPASNGYNGIIIEGQTTGGISTGWGTPALRAGAILKAQGSGFASGMFNVQYSSHIEFRSVTIDMAGVSGRAMSFLDCTDIVIEKCVFESCQQAIYSRAGWDFKTNGCAFRNCGHSGGAAVLSEGTGVRELSSPAPNSATWMFHQCSWLPKPGVCFDSVGAAAADVHFSQCKFEGWSSKGKAAITGNYKFLHVHGCIFFHVDADVRTRVLVPPSPGIPGVAATFGPHIDIDSEFGVVSDSAFYGFFGHAIKIKGRQNKIHGNQFRNSAANFPTWGSYVYFDTVWRPYDMNIVTGNNSYNDHHSWAVTAAGNAVPGIPMVTARDGGYIESSNLGH